MKTVVENAKHALGSKFMITEEDIKELRKYESRSVKICNWLFIIFFVLLVFIGTFNLYLASQMADKIGTNLSTLFQSWFRGIDINIRYSGMHVWAMEKIGLALLEFGVAFVTLIVIYGQYRTKKMYSRILETLKQDSLLSN